MNNLKGNTLSRKILGWFGYFILIAAILFLFAPASWWQFGVANVEDRTTKGNFSLQQLNNVGENWNLAEQRGNVVVVNYWATWCPPCRFEMPGLVSAATEFKTKGVKFVGVTVDEDLSRVPPFIKQYKINFPILLPGNDPNIGDQRMSLPTTFLYDKNGKLAKKYTGFVLESTLKSDIEELLKED